jgi:hypothetical protein
MIYKRSGQQAVCKFCGQAIYWSGNYHPSNADGTRHLCAPKIKIYTKAEVEIFNNERKIKEALKKKK